MEKKVARVFTILFVIAAFLSLGLGATIAQEKKGAEKKGGPAVPPLVLTSTAWEDGGVIPDKYTQKVENPVSPELKWSQVPPGTQTFVLLMHDPEPVLNKGSKMDITHWLAWNIPATSTGLPQGVAQGELPDGTRQISLRLNGYMGPGAPPGP
jgi:phosphatidylethanolamine-binding protein (PEBP) family uncharacterized protein